MAASERVRRAAVSWEGNSLDVLREWPKAIREDFGIALAEMQEGRTATLPVRPMPRIAASVFELKDSDEQKWYRLIYLARVGTPSTCCIALQSTLRKQSDAILRRPSSGGNKFNNGFERGRKMKSKSTVEGKASHVTLGSVLDDLGFHPSESLEIKVKAEIYRELLSYVRERGFSQQELGRSLGIHQPDVSNLLNGRVSKFSVSKLIKFAGKLNLGAQVKLTKPKARKPSRAPVSRKPSTRSSVGV